MAKKYHKQAPVKHVNDPTFLTQTERDFIQAGPETGVPSEGALQRAMKLARLFGIRGFWEPKEESSDNPGRKK